MGKHIATVMSILATGAWLSGCGPIYFPALYHIERPLLFSQDQPYPAWAVGANITAGNSINTPRSRLFGVSAAAGYCIGSPSRILSLRGMALAYSGTIGGENYIGAGILGEPSVNLPLTRWLTVGLLGEIGGAVEFGEYARHFSNSIWPTFGVGLGLAVHPIPQSHILLDARLRLLPPSVRLAYLGSPWGFHISILRDRTGSLGISYLLGEESARVRQR